ncbi:MAG: ABC transporter ATP-binding protein [Ilumatobacteraceae bacterium]
MSEQNPTLELRELQVAYRVRGIYRTVLRDVSFKIAPGESYGLVGESGCGKSTAAFAAMRYLPRNGVISSGSIHFEGRDLTNVSWKEIRELRSRAISMVYQNPITALNPTIRVGVQVAESYMLLGHSKRDSLVLAKEALRKVQIADPPAVMRRYPHQLSGGMAQRVVIAMALASNPRLLVLDEPTTGLDATVEAEVLDLIRGLRAESGTSVLFISHNLGVIRTMCDRVGVLYAGSIVEEGDTQTILSTPSHPYTVGLLRCIPKGGLQKRHDRLDTIPGTPPPLGAKLSGCVFVDRCSLAQNICRLENPPLFDLGVGHLSRCYFHDQAANLPRSIAVTGIAQRTEKFVTDNDAPLLALSHVTKTFKHDGHDIRVLTEIALHLAAGETLGLVGESGSGKTTLARLVLGLTNPDAGSTILLDGTALGATLADRSANEVGSVQIIFQNPDSALNRRHSVTRIVSRAVEKLAGLSKDLSKERARTLLTDMSVDPLLHSVKPAQLSGGLKQRVAIARSFAGNPKLVVCDEPTSALDVSVQATILNLLADLQATENVSYLFISHDLGVVRYLSDRIAVLYLGRIMELGTAETVFSGPHHPYTEALVSSIPAIDGSARQRIRLGGEIPSPAQPPTGCTLHPRCPRMAGSGVEHLCTSQEPELLEAEPGHFMRCHIPLGQLRRMQSPSVGA